MKIETKMEPPALAVRAARRSPWAVALAGVVALAPLACDTTRFDDEDVATVDDVRSAALLTDEERIDQHLDSSHPLANNVREELLVDGPALTRELRIHFRRIDMEDGYDFVSIQDEWGNEIERITGHHRDYTSRVVAGARAKIVLTTDGNQRSFGVRVDAIFVKRCVPHDPPTENLAAAQSCDDLEGRIEERALRFVRSLFIDGGPIRVAAKSGDAPAESAGAPAGAPAHSETNVQVDGVDEADVVKTDGTFIYALAGRELRVFRATPVERAALVTTIKLADLPREMFLFDGKLVVIAGVRPTPVDGGASPVEPLRAMKIAWWRPDTFTKVTTFDVTGDAPRVEGELLLAGQYHDARRVDGSLRIVVDRRIQLPELQTWPEEGEPGTPAFVDAQQRLLATAIAKVHARTLSEWLPQSFRVVDGERRALPLDCQSFHFPARGDGLDITSVVTVDIGATATDTSVQDTSLVLPSHLVYQGDDAIYLTQFHDSGCYEVEAQQGAFTLVHKLDVSAPQRARYVASGGFPGTVDNRFQLDAQGGFLRVATTIDRWGAATPEERSENRVFVVGDVGGHLGVVGKTEALAPGERIFGTRFLGTRAFVVTFRQIDPLFTIDLSDPQNPVVQGELKIPGFSTYLHPLDDTHLFAIGNDFEADGRTRLGTALTIYDVSDLAHPRLTHKAVVGTSHGYSDALYDSKAFTLYRPAGDRTAVIAIPFTDWDDTRVGDDWWNGFQSSLKVFRIGPGGILATGEIDESDLFRENGARRWADGYQPYVRRGVFIERTVFAVADAGLRAGDIDDPASWLVDVNVPAPVDLDEPRPVPLDDVMLPATP